ncbi:MAG: ThiF family adenylyltransferase, partial [Arthrobacter sp.]
MTLRTATDMTLPPLVAPGPDLTRADLERYSRQLILPEIGRTGQRRLKNARVLVIGAGGLGAPVLLYLAAAGVGTLGIVDDDVVEISNLQRQIIHGVADVGRPKVESARDAVAEINP